MIKKPKIIYAFNRIKTSKLKHAELRKIKLLIIDMDGVLSDGRIIYDSQGNDYRIFHVHDGYGIRLAQRKGIKIAFVSGRHSSVIDRRAHELGVDIVYQNIADKTEVLRELLDKYKLKASEVCAIGDDLIDMPLLQQVGVPIAVYNAIGGLKRVAKYITKLHGGNGAVREVIDLIIKAKGK